MGSFKPGAISWELFYKLIFSWLAVQKLSLISQLGDGSYVSWEIDIGSVSWDIWVMLVERCGFSEMCIMSTVRYVLFQLWDMLYQLVDGNHVLCQLADMSYQLGVMCYISWYMWVTSWESCVMSAGRCVTSWEPCVMSAGRCELPAGSHVLCQLADMSCQLVDVYVNW